MPYTEAGKNLMLNALAGTNPTTPITHASLHTGDPTLGNEVSGGSPAYARKAIGYGAASAGQMEDDGDVVFDVPAGTTVSYVGFYSAITGGTLLGYKSVTAEDFGAQGTYTLTQALIDLNS